MGTASRTAVFVGVVLVAALPRSAPAWDPVHYGVDYQRWTEQNYSSVTVVCYALRFDTTKLEAVHRNGATAFWMTPEGWAYLS